MTAVQEVVCVSYNGRFPECQACFHKGRHAKTEQCESKAGCAVARRVGLKGWCKTYIPPKPKAPSKPRKPSATAMNFGW